MALFDLDTGDYGTYTDYDMPPANMEPGAQRKLAMAPGISTSATTAAPVPASWRTCRDERRRSAALHLSASAWSAGPRAAVAMRLDLARDANACTGAGGRADLQRQDRRASAKADTYSYFQTGMAMTGTLRGVSMIEKVTGSRGPRRPTVVSESTPAAGEPGETRGPGRTNGARSISTMAST